MKELMAKQDAGKAVDSSDEDADSEEAAKLLDTKFFF